MNEWYSTVAQTNSLRYKTNTQTWSNYEQKDPQEVSREKEFRERKRNQASAAGHVQRAGPD
jgi:hypothetical protein